MSQMKRLLSSAEKLSVTVSGIIYQWIYNFGVHVMRVILRNYRRFRRAIRIPVMFISSCGRLIAVSVKFLTDKYLLTHYRRFWDSAWELHHHARRSKVNIKKAVSESPKRFFIVSKVLVKKALDDYREVFASLFNYAAPIAAAVILAVTVSYWSSATFALEVQYNNQSLGYIIDESVFGEAEEMAKSQIVNNSKSVSAAVAQSDNNSKNLKTEFLSAKNTAEKNNANQPYPVYKLKRVEIDELSDADSLCAKMVESSQTGVTHACGVYIDGEFICALKNEADAQRVFDAILEEYPHPADMIADFVEEIEFVQGLYADNEDTIWDTEKLRKKLNGTKSAAVYYEVQEGDTPSGIAAANDLTTAQLVAMNPGIDEVIHVGDKVLISNQVKFLQVKLMKTVQRNVEIPYGMDKRENPKMFRGSKKITREGVNGVKQVTEIVTYINNSVVSTKQLSEKVIKEPINSQMDIGTRSTGMSGTYGDYDVSPAGSDFVWPVIGLRRISAHYGYYRWGGRHWGVDIAGPGSSGKKIVAVQSGKVTYAGWDSTGHGYRVIINHGGGLETCYSHTKKGSITVKVGQYVEQGEVIARVGSTGNTTGPHLHFEVHKNGRKVNPEPYLGI